MSPTPVALASGSGDECVVRDLLQTDLDGAETFECEFTGERADGAEVPVEIHGGAIQYEGDPGCIGVLWNRSTGDAPEQNPPGE
jgi:hypothetical protein